MCSHYPILQEKHTKELLAKEAHLKEEVISKESQSLAQITQVISGTHQNSFWNSSQKLNISKIPLNHFPNLTISSGVQARPSTPITLSADMAMETTVPLSDQQLSELLRNSPLTAKLTG